jgi:DNA-binding MarR family transcriptional regulator
MTDAYIAGGDRPGRVRDYRPGEIDDRHRERPLTGPSGATLPPGFRGLSQARGASGTGRARPTRRATTQRITQRGKTLRAFRAYLDVLDTAQWLQDWLRGQMAVFGLTLPGLRLLEMLLREGTMEITEAAAARRCPVQNMHDLVAKLERLDWVRQETVRRHPADVKVTRIPKARRGGKRLGRRVRIVWLTWRGKLLFSRILPRHEKVVKSLMRALDGREQETLSMLCRKLREGDVMRFMSEITHSHAGE